MIFPFQIIINKYTKSLATFHILYNLPINQQSMCHGFLTIRTKYRLVPPFWYRLTWVVPEKGPLNGCVCVCV